MARMRAFACDNDLCGFLTKDEGDLAWSAKIKGPHASQGRTVRTHNALCLVEAVAQDVGAVRNAGSEKDAPSLPTVDYVT